MLGTTQDAPMNDCDMGRCVKERHDGDRLTTMVAATIGAVLQDTPVHVLRSRVFDQTYDHGTRRITAIYAVDGRLADFYDKLKETPKYVGPIPNLQEDDAVVTNTIRATSGGRDYPYRRYDLMISLELVDAFPAAEGRPEPKQEAGVPKAGGQPQP